MEQTATRDDKATGSGVDSPAIRAEKTTGSVRVGVSVSEYAEQCMKNLVAIYDLEGIASVPHRWSIPDAVAHWEEIQQRLQLVGPS